MQFHKDPCAARARICRQSRKRLRRRQLKSRGGDKRKGISIMAKDKISKLIDKGDFFSVLENGKYITVDTLDKRAKYNSYARKGKRR